MSKQRKNKKSFLFLSFLFLIIFLGLSLLSLLYFDQNSDNQKDQKVKFWLYYNDKQIIGEKGQFFVFIKNEEKTDLENVEVTINFPSDFIFDSSSPAVERKLSQGGIWTFEKIDKNVLQEIEIKGTFLGQVDRPKYFEGRVDFSLAGFSSIFQENFSTAIILKPSLLLNWSLPDQSAFGQKIESSLFLENISQEIIPEVEVVINYPLQFSLLDNDFKSEKEGENIVINSETGQLKWKLKDLNAQTRKRLDFTGLITDPLVSELEFSLESGIIFNNQFYPQFKKEKKIVLEEFNFPLKLEINDSFQEKQSVNWGETVPVVLSYENATNQTIENLKLRLKIKGVEYIDFSRLYQSSWHYYQEKSEIESIFSSGKIDSSLISSLGSESGWTSSIISDLRQVPHQQQGKIVFDLPLKNYLDWEKNNNQSFQIQAQLIAQGNVWGKDFSWEIQGNKIELLIKTNLNLNSSVRYYDDEHVKIGTGPLPPQRGKETRFWVFWDLKNTTNGVKNLLVETKLPLGVIWTERTKTSQGLLLYNQEKRIVRWQISELEPYQGGPYSLVEAGFELAVVPTEEQVGQIIPLTESIYLTAQDSLTNDFLSEENNFLNTSLAKDPWWQGNAEVVDNEE
jgi:hypothetical protein